MSEQNQNPNPNPNPNQQSQTLPVVVHSAGHIVVDDPSEQMLMRWSDQRITHIMSLADDDQDAEVLEGRMNGLADLKTRNVVGQVIEIAGLVAHVVELADKLTGEVTLKERVCFLLADGRVLSSTSASCVRAARMMLRRRGRGRWNPPVRARVDELPLDGGKSACIMTVLPSQPTTQNGAKRK